jgi:hypothetical protein
VQSVAVMHILHPSDFGGYARWMSTHATVPRQARMLLLTHTLLLSFR